MGVTYQVFKIAPGGSLRMTKDGDNDKAIEVQNFHTPEGNGVALEKALGELGYGDFVLLTIIRKNGP